MSNSKKYVLSHDVEWRYIMRVFRNRIFKFNNDAVYYLKCIEEDKIHNYPDFIEFDTYHAFSYCSRLYECFSIFNDLRSFLGYKKVTSEDLKISEGINFYLDNIGRFDSIPDFPKKRKYCYPD